MPQTLQPTYYDFEYSDKMGLSAFVPQLIQDLVRIQLSLSCCREKAFLQPQQTGERWSGGTSLGRR